MNVLPSINLRDFGTSRAKLAKMVAGTGMSLEEIATEALLSKAQEFERSGTISFKRKPRKPGQPRVRRDASIDQIQRRVADHFGIGIDDMTSKRRPAAIAFPRQIAMYLARKLTKATLCEIGAAFGGRDHGTVIHACKLVGRAFRDDPRLRATIQILQQGSFNLESHFSRIFSEGNEANPQIHTV